MGPQPQDFLADLFEHGRVVGGAESFGKGLALPLRTVVVQQVSVGLAVVLGPDRPDVVLGQNGDIGEVSAEVRDVLELPSEGARRGFWRGVLAAGVCRVGGARSPGARRLVVRAAPRSREHSGQHGDGHYAPLRDSRSSAHDRTPLLLLLGAVFSERAAYRVSRCRVLRRGTAESLQRHSCSLRQTRSTPCSRSAGGRVAPRGNSHWSSGRTDRRADACHKKRPLQGSARRSSGLPGSSGVRRHGSRQGRRRTAGGFGRVRWAVTGC